MVRKLFKHEFAALGRILLPAYAVLPIIAVVTRILQFFQVDHPAYQLAFFGTVAFFFMACFVVTLLTMATGVVRYYTHFFTRQGYLTFTLPATPTQQLWVKLSSLTLFYAFASLTIVISGLIAIRWELLIEIIRAAVYIVKTLVEQSNLGFGLNLGAVFVEYLVLLAIGTVNGILVLYTCMNIGQLARKARIVWSIVAYFAYEAVVYIVSLVLQILLTMGTILIAALTQVESLETIIIAIDEFITNHPFLTMHSVLGIAMLGQIVFGVVLFLVSRYILKRRLNLE